MLSLYVIMLSPCLPRESCCTALDLLTIYFPSQYLYNMFRFHLFSVSFFIFARLSNDLFNFSLLSAYSFLQFFLYIFIVNLLHHSLCCQAIGIGLSCVTEEYEILMADPVLHLVTRMVADRAASTRKELGLMCRNLLYSRLGTFGRRAIEDALSASMTLDSQQSNALKYGSSEESSKWDMVRGGTVSTRTGELNENSVSADLQLVALLLVLQGDDADEVVAVAKEVSNDFPSEL
jgi:hypothetical protein